MAHLWTLGGLARGLVRSGCYTSGARKLLGFSYRDEEFVGATCRHDF